MGTPEFPDLGKHCSLDDCRQIDFLPFTCDRCRQVFCLEHRSYTKHKCPKADYQGVTVLICPLCAKGVRLNPDEDPNINWESHFNTECDPSNYEKVTKKKRCPVPRCKEILSFSNTIKCRDCAQEHCLKHRFGLDHNCPGPQKQEPGFWSILSASRREDPRPNKAPSSSSGWTASLLNAVSSVSQALQTRQNGNGVGGHVEKMKIHGRSCNGSGVKELPVQICPKCGGGFRDAAALVEHVRRDHRGMS